MSHVYSNTFFDYIDAGARSSARRVTGLVQPWLRARSVLDIGCGRGSWLAVWKEAGTTSVLGVDGDYVDRATLAIPPDAFFAADLTRPLILGRRFDLAQCLEVGEHLPRAASETLVHTLTRHADIVLFSAAVRGQGGEFHVNEQPLSFWQALFAAEGYAAFDCIRPGLAGATEVEPWYRYNTILYANRAAQARLPEAVLSCRVPEGEPVRDGGGLSWRLRRLLVSCLSQRTATRIATARAAWLARRTA